MNEEFSVRSKQRRSGLGHRQSDRCRVEEAKTWLHLLSLEALMNHSLQLCRVWDRSKQKDDMKCPKGTIGLRCSSWRSPGWVLLCSAAWDGAETLLLKTPTEQHGGEKQSSGVQAWL